ncbi:uncharacterized protein EV422DRAFT_563885 [Fimicolochytrium jonesii]|uniref:uncharacterized protein n=1 Tax=Fimicolochytrium jonesii TaxID=1396493 RepID=UPI0022FED1FF|nr:uncharacterized protein EV422DRAFT_563885 [Fimicolochytrium jonesii]KAI8826076.1 hypothetical protein EV422DRAFT_563885 [Fimicolochytrium jonesii]
MAPFGRRHHSSVAHKLAEQEPDEDRTTVTESMAVLTAKGPASVMRLAPVDERALGVADDERSTTGKPQQTDTLWDPGFSKVNGTVAEPLETVTGAVQAEQKNEKRRRSAAHTSARSKAPQRTSRTNYIPGDMREKDEPLGSLWPTVKAKAADGDFASALKVLPKAYEREPLSFPDFEDLLRLASARPEGTALAVFILKHIRRTDDTLEHIVNAFYQGTLVIPWGSREAVGQLIASFLKVKQFEAAIDAFHRAKLERDDFVDVRLVLDLCDAGLFEDAKMIFNLMDRQHLNRESNRRLFFGLFSALPKCGTKLDFSSTYAEMKARNVVYTKELYQTVIRACLAFGAIERATATFEEMVGYPFQPDTNIYCAFIRAYTRPPHANTALLMMWYDSMVVEHIKPTLKAYTNMLAHFAREGKLESLEAVWADMTHFEIKPDLHAYTTMMLAYARQGQAGSAERWFKMMLDDQHTPDSYAYSALLMGYIQAQNLEAAQRLMAELVRRQAEVDEQNKRLATTDAEADIQAAKQTKRKERRPDKVPSLVNTNTYNILIKELIRVGDVHATRWYIEEMRKSGIEPDTYTCLSVMQGYISTSNIHEGLQMYHAMVAQGVVPNNHIYSKLVNMLGHAKAASQDIRHVMEDMIARRVEPDVYTWTAIMFAFGRAGEPEMAIKIWEQLRNLRAEENAVGGENAKDATVATDPIDCAPVLIVDDVCFLMFLYAVLGLSERLGGVKTEEGLEWLNRLLDETRWLVGNNMVFTGRSWDVLIRKVAGRGDVLVAAEIVEIALRALCDRVRNVSPPLRAETEIIIATSNNTDSPPSLQSAPASDTPAESPPSAQSESIGKLVQQIRLQQSIRTFASIRVALDAVLVNALPPLARYVRWAGHSARIKDQLIPLLEVLRTEFSDLVTPEHLTLFDESP